MRDLTLIILVLVLGIGTSQVPRFTQEYVQRLGGATQEADLNANRDVANAQGRGMTVAAYVSALETEGPLAREQADGIRARALRQAELHQELDILLQTAPALRPLVVLRDHDLALLSDTWTEFRVSLTFDLIYGVVGVAVGWLLNSFAWWALRPRHRRQTGFA